MKKFIFQYVKQFSVSAVLTSRVCRGLLDFYVIDWISRDGSYYSLFVPCNETQLFTHDLKLLGSECCPVVLGANLRRFADKKAWTVGRWGIQHAEILNERLKPFLEGLSFSVVEYAGYRLDKVYYVLRPYVQIIFTYSYRNEYAGSFSAVWGQESLIGAHSRHHFYFLQEVIEAYRLEGCCRICRKGE